MNVLAILLLHSIKRVRVLVLTIAIFVALIQVLLVQLAASLEQDGQLTQFASLFPPFFRNLLGPGIAAFMSFDGILGLGYFHPAAIAAITAMAIAVATQLAVEVESGFSDLLLARPIARHWLVTRAVVMSIGSIAIAALAMLGGSAVGVMFMSTHAAPAWSTLTHLAANLAMVTLCWSAVALVIASISRRRATANGITGLLAVVAFLVDYVARLWGPAKSIAPLSPFHYFSPMETILGELPPMIDWTILTLIAMSGFAISYVLFLRRDISR